MSPKNHGKSGLPLTPMQAGMLYHHLSLPGRGFDIEQIHFVLAEELDIERFRGSWQWLTDRHAALRTTIDWESGDNPLQVAAASATVDFRYRNAPDADWDLHALLEQDRREGLDLRSGPLSRVTVFRRGEQLFEGIWTFHHILFDGRCFPLLLQELFEHYEGASSRLDEPRVGAFAEHVALLDRHHGNAEAAQFWSSYLDGLEAPTPAPLRASGESDGAPDLLSPEQVSHELSSARTEAIRRLVTEQGATLNSAVQAAWAIALGAFTRSRDVVFGATRACRHGTIEDADRTVGVFINTLPVRARLEPESTVGELLRQLRKDDLATRDHEHTALVEVQSAAPFPTSAPLFETNIVFDTYELGARLRSLGGRWTPRDFTLYECAPFAVTLYGNLTPELELRIAFDGDRFERAEARWLLSTVVAVLEQMGRAGAAERRLDQLSLLRAEDRNLVVETWNDTATEVADETMVAAFAHQVELRPEAIAITDGRRELTFSELDTGGRPAGENAHRAGCRTRSDHRAVCRPLHRAGGRCARHPQVRLALPASRPFVPGSEAPPDARGLRVRAAPRRRRRAPPPRPAATSTSLSLDRPARRSSAAKPTPEPAEAPAVQPDVQPSDLAYVIYTSGSNRQTQGSHGRAPPGHQLLRRHGSGRSGSPRQDLARRHQPVVSTSRCSRSSGRSVAAPRSSLGSELGGLATEGSLGAEPQPALLRGQRGRCRRSLCLAERRRSVRRQQRLRGRLDSGASLPRVRGPVSQSGGRRGLPRVDHREGRTPSGLGGVAAAPPRAHRGGVVHRRQPLQWPRRRLVRLGLASARLRHPPQPSPTVAAPWPATSRPYAGSGAASA